MPMPTFADLLVVVGMLAVRIGLPVLGTVGLVYLLKRLDRRWEAEAREFAAKHAGEQPAEQPAQPRPAERPATPKRAPEGQLPFVPPPAREPSRVQPGVSMGTAAQSPDVRGRSEPVKASCSTPTTPGKPCWQARFDAEGSIPEECVNCDVFQRYPMI